MAWSYQIGRVGGTAVKVHSTFLLLLAFFCWGGYQRGGVLGAVAEGGALLALFACVVLHEFGHILMARRFGVRTPDVLLLPIGGVARLERIPDEPRQELLIALAGPAVTLGIATLLYLGLAIVGPLPTLAELFSENASFIPRLLAVNVVLLVFNLLPAFPMDGGRVLRALLAQRLGLARATRIAARIGQTLAVALGIFALAGKIYLLALIAVFVFVGAGTERAMVETRAAGRGLSVAQVMVTHFRSIPIHARLQQAVEMLLNGEQREFPVVDNAGRVEGLLTREDLRRGLAQRGADSTVAESMSRPPVVQPEMDFDHALERLRASGLPAVPVVDGAGALVGLLTLDNVSDLLMVRRAAGTG